MDLFENLQTMKEEQTVLNSAESTKIFISNNLKNINNKPFENILREILFSANIDWKDILIAIPAFFIIIMMPFSYSITTGIEFGFIFYALISIANKKAKEVSPMIYIFTLLFIIEFVYNIVA